MMFRRFLQRLKQHQWGAIATELAIVIIGVFIGMQVSNWNEDRETNQKAAVFTVRLIDDLRKEAWGYQYLIEYNRETNANQRRVLDAMVGKTTLSEEQFMISAYRATQYYYNNVRFRSTFDELVSTGNIGLIGDEKLRTASIAIFTTPLLDQITQTARDSEYRRLFRETISADIQTALLARCGDHDATVLDYASLKDTLDYPCTLGLPPEDIHVAADALRALPRFAPALRMRFADNQTALTDLQINQKVAALK